MKKLRVRKEKERGEINKKSRKQKFKEIADLQFCMQVNVEKQGRQNKENYNTTHYKELNDKMPTEE